MNIKVRIPNKNNKRKISKTNLTEDLLTIFQLDGRGCCKKHLVDNDDLDRFPEKHYSTHTEIINAISDAYSQIIIGIFEMIWVRFFNTSMY